MGNIIAIMQPTYLPWVGYFDLIDSVDAFVFLDNVQFEKQSWQQRNKIRTSTELAWLTLPVLHTGNFGQLISEVLLANSNFIKKHLSTIRLHYCKANFFETFFLDFENIFKEAASAGKLLDLNLKLIQWINVKLGIKTPIFLASELGCMGKRSELLINLCQLMVAEKYLSPVGSLEYLKKDHSMFLGAGIHVNLHNYVHPIYCQRYSPFIPYACALDLLFNEGPSSLQIIRSGRRDPIPLENAI